MPLKLSVTLWTVFTELSFEHLLEKVAEADITTWNYFANVTNWTEADFKRANAKRKERGIAVDWTAPRAADHGANCVSQFDPPVRPQNLANVSGHSASVLHRDLWLEFGIVRAVTWRARAQTRVTPEVRNLANTCKSLQL